MVGSDAAAKQYKRKQIESATPGQLVVLLYDGAIDYLNRAELELDAKDPGKIERFHNNLIACQNIITELLVSLDMEKGGEIAQNLFRLYEYMNHRLVQANVKKDPEVLEEVKDLLAMLRGAWHDIAEQDAGRRRSQQAVGLNLQG